MMKNKKGFTLIEVLAVIVIIGVIALISVPVVGNITENSKRSGIKTSVTHYMKALEQEANLDVTESDLEQDRLTINKDGTYIVNGKLKKLDIKGSIPSNGTVCINDAGDVKSYSVIIDGYVVSNTNGTQKIEKGDTPLSITCNVEVEEVEIKIPSDQLVCTQTKKIEIVYPTYEEVEKQYKFNDSAWTEYTGPIEVNKNGILRVRLYDTVNKKTSNEATLILTKIDEEMVTNTAPSLVLSTERPTSEIKAIFNQTDDCEIDPSTIEYGISETKDGKYTYQQKPVFNNLLSNTTYYVKTRTNDIAKRGIVESEISQIKTKDFGTCIIDVSNPLKWETKKNVTITGETVPGTTLQYKIYKAYTKEDSGWIDTTSGVKLTINTMSILEKPTTVFCRYVERNSSNEIINMVDPAISTSITRIDTTAPELTLDGITTTTKSITIPFEAKDLESGINETTCVYGTSTNYDKKGTISGNKCIINDETSGTTYYYKITTTNNVNLPTELTGNTKTVETGTCSVEITDETIWKPSKVATIKGNITTGESLQYRIVSGDTEKVTWTTVNSGKTYTIDWAANATTPTSVYCRVTDGKNTKDGLTKTQSKIDPTAANTTAPSITSSTTNPTKAVVVTNKQTDPESGIYTNTTTGAKSIEYGYSTSSTGTYTWQASSTISNLTQGETYYFKTRVKNGAGIGWTESAATSYKIISINMCLISITDENVWKTSKVATISGSQAGVTLQYRIKSGDTTKVDWTTISSGKTHTINWAANLTTPTYIYCRMSDGKTTVEGTVKTQTKIDITAANTTAPAVAKSPTNPTKAMVITNKQEDPESGIYTNSTTGAKSIEYGYSTSSTGTYTWQTSNTINNLTQGTSYYVKTRVKNGAGTGWTESAATKHEIDPIVQCKVEMNTTNWASSKVATITGSQTGVTLQYQIKSGDTTKVDWTTINSGKTHTINWAANLTTPTSIYCRTTDGKNTLDGETYAETKVDITAASTTAPTLTASTTNPTKAVVVTNKQDDAESGIKSIQYGYSTSETGTYTWQASSTINDLVQSGTYYIKTRVINNAGTGWTESVATVYIVPGIKDCGITMNTTSWAASKVATISGSQTGVTLQYRIISGETVKKDWTTISDGGTTTINWAANTTTPTRIYCRMTDGKSVKDGTNIYSETKVDITAANTTAPSIVENATNPTKAANVIRNQSDGESGISSTQYGYSTSATGTYTWGTSSTINGLKQDTKYYFKTRVKNGANTGWTESAATEFTPPPMATCGISITPSGWAASKVATISGSQTGVTLQYQIKSGTTVKKDWTTISDGGTTTINWVATTTTPTYVYCRMTDGTNTKNSATKTETAVDPTPANTTAPSVVKSPTNPTKAIVVTNKQADAESGIKSIQYGYSTSSTGTYTWQTSSTINGLTQGGTYYVKTRVTNNAGLGWTESTSTKHSPDPISNCSISMNTTSLARSKVATITGGQTGVTLQYRIVSGGTEKVTWTTISSGKTHTIDWAADTTTPTYIYCRVTDGTTTLSNQYTESNICRNGPTVPGVTYNGGSNSCSWKNNYNLTLSSSSCFAIAHYEIDVNNDGTADGTAGSNFVPSNGWSTCSARFRAVDTSGWKSGWTGENHIHMDTQGPIVTTITYNGGSNSCSWKNNYNLTLSSSDNVGVKHFEVDWDGDGAANTTTGSNFIPWDGYSSCNNRFRAVDHAGNVGPWSDVQHIHMDTSRPGDVQVTYNSGANSCTWKNNYNLTLSATDNVGVSGYQIDWSGDGVADATVGSNFIPGNGYHSHNTRFRAVDHAGNVSSNWTGEHHIHMDTEKPSTPSISLSNPSGTWANSTTASASSTDNVGIAAWYYSHDKNSQADYPNPWTINWNGSWPFYVRAKDHAGNYSDWSYYWLGIARSATVTYKTTYESGGDLSASDGAMSGHGNSTKMYTINISASSPSGVDGNVEYNVHSESIGWSGWKSAGTTAGSTGKRIEGIQIRLTGNMANVFDVYYKVHVQSIGDLGWAKNGEIAGSQSLCKRLEKIAIKIIPKDEDPAAHGINYGAAAASVTDSSKTNCETATTCTKTCTKQENYTCTCCTKYSYVGAYSITGCSSGTSVSVASCGGGYAECCRVCKSYSDSCTCTRNVNYTCC